MDSVSFDLTWTSGSWDSEVSFQLVGCGRELGVL